MEFALYGYESTQVPVMVVSLTGRSCMTLWPVAATQSTSFFRSWKSPIPKLSSVLREKTGTAVPAHFQLVWNIFSGVRPSLTLNLGESWSMLKTLSANAEVKNGAAAGISVHLSSISGTSVSVMIWFFHSRRSLLPSFQHS